MSCRRSLEIDLAGFLAEPRAEVHRDFREHYPLCAECAAEVRAWTELHEGLAAPHPEPELMARYEALDAGARGAIDRHAAGCVACREELAQLAAFDPARLRAAAAAPAVAPAAPETPGWRELLAALGRILWHPAFGYAMALLLIFPLVYRGAGPDVEIAALPRALDAPAELVLEEALPLADDDAEQRERMAESKQVAKSAPAPRVAQKQARKTSEGGPAKDLRAQPEEPAVVAGAARLEAAAAAGKRDRADVAMPAQANVMAEAEMADEADAVEKLEPSSQGLASSHFAARGLPSASASGRLAREVATPAPDVEGTLPLALRADRTVQLSLAPGVDWLELSVPVPDGVAPGSDTDVRIDFGNGRRELLERLVAPPAASDRRFSVRIPRGWLAPGVYQVGVGPPGAPPQARFAFRIDAAP